MTGKSVDDTDVMTHTNAAATAAAAPGDTACPKPSAINATNVTPISTSPTTATPSHTSNEPGRLVAAPPSQTSAGLSLPEMIRNTSNAAHGVRGGGSWTTPHHYRYNKDVSAGGYASPSGASTAEGECFTSTPAMGGANVGSGSPFQQSKSSSPIVRGSLRVSNKRGGSGRVRNGQQQNSACPASLSLITCSSGDPLLFSETNLDWTKLNIFRTRLCDRLTHTRVCHMANRCLFSHEMAWPRRTPFLPRASALTLRYIPVWCPRVCWPPLKGLCDSAGKIDWQLKPTAAADQAAGGPAVAGASACQRGDNCPFVHSIEEFLYHPEIYKTRSCSLANDENFDEDIQQQNCVALCPWYFCPFAHDAYEIRDLRGSRYAWHQPPQIVDNQYVARTQGFDKLEMAMIDFVRKHSATELYTLASSPLKAGKGPRSWLPEPVLEPAPGSSLEALSSAGSLHGSRANEMDDLLCLMALASLINLLLYPVENFYVPTLLSLQCAILQYQLNESLPLSAAQLVAKYNAAVQQPPSTYGATWPTEQQQHPAAQAGGIDLETLIDLLQREDIFRSDFDPQQQRKNR